MQKPHVCKLLNETPYYMPDAIKADDAGIRHPQTNGKLERLHGKIQRKLPEFEAIMMRKSDPVNLFMEWYNRKRPHMSLGVDGASATLVHALIRKMPPRGETVVEKQTGEEYHVK